MIKIEIIAIGNEVLQGDVQDTNTHWLSQQLTGLGGRVERAVIVRDDQTAIVAELKGAIARQARLILTTGGLGPTNDDLTLAAVAEMAGRPLQIHQQALEWVKNKYNALAHEGAVDDAAMTPAREKMARLPQGAQPLANPVGTAPGVLLALDGCQVVSLPGVPPELKGIFEGALQPTLKALFGESAFLEKRLLVNCKDESVLAPILEAVAARHPDVYVKSRAKSFGPDVKFRVTLSTAGPSKPVVEQTLNEAQHDLEQALAARNISINS